MPAAVAVKEKQRFAAFHEQGARLTTMSIKNASGSMCPPLPSHIHSAFEKLWNLGFMLSYQLVLGSLTTTHKPSIKLAQLTKSAKCFHEKITPILHAEPSPAW
eukprot:943713-Pelagomonas_calceolata.AAC.1